MGLSVYYPQDIRNALLAAEQSASAVLQTMSNDNDPIVVGYRQGYRAALVTIALAFGLFPENGKGHKDDIIQSLLEEG